MRYRIIEVVGTTLFALIITGITVPPVYFWVRDFYKPARMRVVDVNEDGLPDVIVRSANDDTYVYLGQTDGTARLLQDVQNDKLNALDEGSVQRRSTIEEETKAIMERADAAVK